MFDFLWDLFISSNSLIYNNSTALGYGVIIDASNQIVLGTSSEHVKIPGPYVGIGGVYNTSSGYALDVFGSINFTGNLCLSNLFSHFQGDLYPLVNFTTFISFSKLFTAIEK